MDDTDFECRVCRGGAEENHPLYSPCLCRGSIMYCHQDCLVEWLTHSKTDNCELCGTKYVFTPLYSKDMPTVLSPMTILRETLNSTFTQVLPYVVRMTIALFLWLAVVPFCVSWVFRYLISNHNVFSRLTTDIDSLRADVTSGIVLIATMSLSFIVLLSFVEFLRAYWNLEERPANENVVEGNLEVVPNANLDFPNPEPNPIPNLHMNLDQQPNPIVLPPNVELRDLEQFRDPVDVEAIQDAYHEIDAMQDEIKDLRKFRDQIRACGGPTEYIKKFKSNIKTKDNTQSENKYYESDSETDSDSDVTMLRHFVQDLDELDELNQETMKRESSNIFNKLDKEKFLKTKFEMENSLMLQKIQSYDNSNNLDGMSGNSVGESDKDYAHINAYSNANNAAPAENASGSINANDSDFMCGLPQTESSVGLKTVILPEASSSSSAPPNFVDFDISDSESDSDSDDEDMYGRKMHEQMHGMTGNKDVNDGDAEEMHNNERPVFIEDGENDEDVLENIINIEHANDEEVQQLPNPMANHLLDEAVVEVDIFAVDGEFEDDDLVIGAEMPDEVPVPAAAGAAAANPQNDGNAVRLAQRLEIAGFLGFNGPIINLFKNIAKVCLCFVAFIVIVGFLPSIVGSQNMKFYSKLFNKLSIYMSSAPLEDMNEHSSYFGTIYSYCVTSLHTVWKWSGLNSLVEVMQLISEKSFILNKVPKLDDFFVIAMGYVSFFFFVSLLSYGFYLIPLRFQEASLIKMFNQSIQSLNRIVKVGSLLFLRILVLPLCLGVCLLVIFDTQLMHFTIDEVAHFFSMYTVGSIGLLWVMGITFMLAVTLSILQLREVLHPDILARVIRPQESQHELMYSLLFDGSLIHFKRMISSGMVYIGIATIYMYLPLKLYTSCMHWLGMQPFQLRLMHWYLCTELQLPIELGAMHICLLTVLEKRKNIIGRVQHELLYYVTKKIGIHHTLLPFKKVNNTEKPKSGSKQSLEDNVVDTDGDEFEFEDVPIKRPPPGWDSRKRTNVSRWSWTDNAKSDVEKSVAPRIFPKYWVFKIIVVLVLQWIFVVCVLGACTIVPVLMGRYMVMDMLQLPRLFHHDPVHFAIGAVMLSTMFHALRNLLKKSDSFMKLVQTISNIPSTGVVVLLKIVFCHVASSIAIGIILLEIQRISGFLYMCLSNYESLRLGETVGEIPMLILGGYGNNRPEIQSFLIKTSESINKPDVALLFNDYTYHSLMHLYDAMKHGFAWSMVITWALCSGMLKQVLSYVSMVLRAVGFENLVPEVIPDWYGICALFLSDLSRGSVDRLMVHIQLTYSNIAHPIFRFMIPSTNVVFHMLGHLYGVCFTVFLGFALAMSGLSPMRLSSHSVDMEGILFGVVFCINILKCIYTLDRVFRIAECMIVPSVTAAYNRIYEHIKEEKYLIGKQLQNCIKE